MPVEYRASAHHAARKIGDVGPELDDKKTPLYYFVP